MTWNVLHFLRHGLVALRVLPTYSSAFVFFAVVATAASAAVVQHGIDAEFRGYPLSFIVIGSGFIIWDLPRLLMDLGFYAVYGCISIWVSRLRIPLRFWVMLGVATVLMFAGIIWWLRAGVEGPVVGTHEVNRAMRIAKAIDYAKNIGLLIMLGIAFVCVLKITRPCKEKEFADIRP